MLTDVRALSFDKLYVPCACGGACLIYDGVVVESSKLTCKLGVNILRGEFVTVESFLMIQV